MASVGSVFKTAGFRAALVYLGLFLISAAGALAYLYVETRAVQRASHDDLIWRDAAIFGRLHSEQGREALVDLLAHSETEADMSVYRLSNSAGVALAGNIDTLPEPTDAGDGWLAFTLSLIHI